MRHSPVAYLKDGALTRIWYFEKGVTENANVHIPVVTKTHLTQVLMMVSQCFLKYSQKLLLASAHAKNCAALRSCAAETVFDVFDCSP